MPKGFTDSVKKAMSAFEVLKQESLIQGKNLVSLVSVAKKSGVSRTNFYEKKSLDWVKIVDEIENFSEEFQKLSMGKHKNPKVEHFKKLYNEEKKKYLAMANQNIELLQKYNDLSRIIDDKEHTIKILTQRLNNKVTGEN